MILLVCPALAFADVLFFTANDICRIEDTSEFHFWDAGAGTPTLLTSSADPDTNKCALQFAVTSGGTLSRAKTVTSATTIAASMHINAASCPTARREIMRFRNSGGKTGCLISAHAGTTVAGVTSCIYESAYESPDPVASSGECYGSLTMDGTECGGSCTGSGTCDTGGVDCTNCVTSVNLPANVSCTGGICVNECDKANADISGQCKSAVYALSPRVATNTWQSVTLQQINNGGRVQCGLWTGALPRCVAGSNIGVACTVNSQCPASTCGTGSIPRGGPSRKQGICTGGDRAKTACALDVECSGGGACTITDVVAIDEVWFGTSDATAGAFTYTLDDMVIETTAIPNANYRMDTLWGESDPSLPVAWSTSSHCGGAGLEYACWDDASATAPEPDADYTEIHTSTQGRQEDAILSDISPALSGAESVLAVGHVIVMRTGNTAANTAHGFLDGAKVATTATLDARALFGDTSYHLLPPYVLINSPEESDGWSESEVNNLEERVEAKNPVSSLTVTSAVAEVLIDGADATVPNVLFDANLDNQKSVGYAGDSTRHSQAFKLGLQGGLLEPDNLVACAMDGIKAGDIARDISLPGAVNDLLEGASTSGTTGGGGGMVCENAKGSTNIPLDILVIEAGPNDWVIDSFFSDPANVVSLNGVGACSGGSNDGVACAAGVCSGGTVSGVYCASASTCTGGGTCIPFACTGGGTCVSRGTGMCRDRQECGGGSNNGTACTADSTCTGGGTCGAGASQGAACVCNTTQGNRQFPAYDTITCTAGVCAGGIHKGEACDSTLDCGRSFCSLSGAQRNTVVVRDLLGVGRSCTCTSDADCKLKATETGGTCAGAPWVAPTPPYASPSPAPTFTPRWCAATVGAPAQSDVLYVPPIGSWYADGCRHAPGCPNGICVQGNSTGAVRKFFTAVNAAVAARSLPTTWATPTPPAPTPPAATPTPRLPIVIWDAPMSGIEDGTLRSASFSTTRGKAGAMRARIRQQPYFIDSYGYVLTHGTDRLLGEIATTSDGTSPNGRMSLLRDGIHPSDYGDTLIDEVYIKCLTHAEAAAGGVGVVDGKARDGICTSSYCSQGLLGNHCVASADCDSYRCP